VAGAALEKHQAPAIGIPGKGQFGVGVEGLRTRVPPSQPNQAGHNKAAHARIPTTAARPARRPKNVQSPTDRPLAR
jgi:hypothetical protein